MTVMQADTAPERKSINLAHYIPDFVHAIQWAIALFLLVGLFGRIMTFPLSHDEQIHVAAARLVFHEPLYQALGYNHLPGLPLLLGGFFAAMGTDHLLQTGRVLIFLCWIATFMILRLIVRHYSNDDRVSIVAMLVLAAGTLLGPAGMLVTNNFLPIPFALLGFHLFIIGLEDDRPQPVTLFCAGIAMGFAIILKVSYVFLVPPIALATLLVPKGLTWGRRIRLVVLPVALGGMLGCLPALYVLATDPQTLFAHTVRYFTGGHLAYWEHSTEPKAMTIPAKILVAEDVWLAGSGVLAAVLVSTFGFAVGQSGWRGLYRWPIALAAALVVFAAIGAFAPTPAFPQYYEPPVPFLIVLFILLHRELDHDTRARMQPILITVTILALAMIIPRLVSSLPAATRSSHWTGNMIHNQGLRVHELLAADNVKGKVATLAPIVALEGGLPIYREFAAGPFLYRVAEYLPAADRHLFVTTSPQELPNFLDKDRPAAIITGREPTLDPAFADYARTRHYIEADTGDPDTQLFVRSK